MSDMRPGRGASRDRDPIDVRSYGGEGPLVALIHGGPGAPGHMASMARELSSRFRVLEPLQRTREAEPLTVAMHIQDLHEALRSRAGGKVHLVGSSWGAMLALAYAAEHTESVRSIVAIGCGTFDARTRSLFEQRLAERLDNATRQRLAELETEDLDADSKLNRKASLLLPACSHDLITAELEHTAVDARGNRETWSDMLRLQEAGVYPQAFTRIRVPVLMLHGDVDPHPGEEIRASLAPYLPHLAYHEWPNCGHYPWLERSTRTLFYERLIAWLDAK